MIVGSGSDNPFMNRIINYLNKGSDNTMQTLLPHYLYRGARAMVLLHEQHHRSFLATWQDAYRVGFQLPQTTDPDFQSLQLLLRHVLGASRGELLWICQKLDLPDPDIDPVPPADHITSKAASYLEHLLERWREPLANVQEERFFVPTHTSGWGVEYCIDAMLEHAVMHPIRHEFQLQELMAARYR